MCVSNETERMQKFGSQSSAQITPKVNAVQETGATVGHDKHVEKEIKVEQTLIKEIMELKAEIAAVKKKG